MEAYPMQKSDVTLEPIRKVEAGVTLAAFVRSLVEVSGFYMFVDVPRLRIPQSTVWAIRGGATRPGGFGHQSIALLLG